MLANIIRGWNELSIYRKTWRVVLVGLIVFAAWAASPLFYSRTVNETFPAAAPAAPTAMAEQPTAPAMMAEQPAAPAAMTDKPAAPTAMAEQLTSQAIADTAMSPAMVEQPAATALPAGPIALQTGSLVDGSLPGHHAAGTTTIYRLEDGRRVLRLENFDATNGPDLFVTLHSGTDPEQDQGEYFQIAPLKGNRGDQNYDLPADIDLSQYKSVVIWCRTFNVVFGYATLQPAA